jgi:hypothetical protein
LGDVTTREVVEYMPRAVFFVLAVVIGFRLALSAATFLMRSV